MEDGTATSLSSSIFKLISRRVHIFRKGLQVQQDLKDDDGEEEEMEIYSKEMELMGSGVPLHKQYEIF